MDNLRITTGRLLVRPLIEEEHKPAEEESIKKITAPDRRIKDPCDEDAWVGKIVKIGPPGKEDEDTFAVGENALFGNYAGEALMLDGVYHRVVSYDDPLLVFTD